MKLSNKLYDEFKKVYKETKGSSLDVWKGKIQSEITPMEKDDYINVVADALEIIPPDITIHRLTGDAPRDLLIAPLWSRDKKSVLNGINMELKKRGTMQGSRVISWL